MDSIRNRALLIFVLLLTFGASLATGYTSEHTMDATAADGFTSLMALVAIGLQFWYVWIALAVFGLLAKIVIG